MQSMHQFLIILQANQNLSSLDQENGVSSTLNPMLVIQLNQQPSRFVNVPAFALRQPKWSWVYSPK